MLFSVPQLSGISCKRSLLGGGDTYCRLDGRCRGPDRTILRLLPGGPVTNCYFNSLFLERLRLPNLVPSSFPVLMSLLLSGSTHDLPATPVVIKLHTSGKGHTEYSLPEARQFPVRVGFSHSSVSLATYRAFMVFLDKAENSDSCRDRENDQYVPVCVFSGHSPAPGKLGDLLRCSVHRLWQGG